MGLDEIRRQIDSVDGQMKQLFLQRMDLADQVAGEKKHTGAAVYAPKREEEVLCARTDKTEEAYYPECLAFFKQMMEISRLHQYSKLADPADDLKALPAGEGEAVVEFFCTANDRQLAVFLNAAAIANLTVKNLTVKEEEGKVFCRLFLAGDFSSDLARGAVLQMLKENESASIILQGGQK